MAAFFSSRFSSSHKAAMQSGPGRKGDCKMHDKVRGPNFGQILSFYLPTIGTSLGK